MVQHGEAQQLSAVSQSALAVSPAISEQVLSVGQPTNFNLQVTNVTSFPLPIKGSIKNLTPFESLLPGANTSIYDASNWFQLDPADFILQPNQTKTIAVTITPPLGATPGGHYATVYFQPLVPTEALTPSTAYLNARVGVLAFLIVRGTITERASIGGLQVPGLRQSGPVAFKIPVINNGNVHLLPVGTLVIRNYRGKIISQLPLPTGLVLPKTEKTYQLQWKTGVTPGYYSAQAELRYGTDKISLMSPIIHFWIVPWIPIVFGLAAGSLLIVVIRRTHGRWLAAWKALQSGDQEHSKKSE